MFLARLGRLIGFPLILCLMSEATLAQDSSADKSRIEEIVVMSTRVERSVGDVPAAVSVIEKNAIQRVAPGSDKG